jgi:hypothetical protein
MKGEPSYGNGAFIASDDARPLRILAEYLQPLLRFPQADIHDTVVFFGSRIGSSGYPWRVRCASDAGSWPSTHG